MDSSMASRRRCRSSSVGMGFTGFESVHPAKGTLANVLAGWFQTPRIYVRGRLGRGYFSAQSGTMAVWISSGYPGHVSVWMHRERVDR